MNGRRRFEGFGWWLLAGWMATGSLLADEGMFPVSDIAGLNLMEHGLEISPSEVFNEEGVCLIDGICRVNGCTGSFVSPQGLIITNHHCAYRAIQRASSPDHDLLQNGYLARTRGDEIPAEGYEVRITESYRDVSAEVLEAIAEDMSFADRTRAIEQRIKEIEKQAEAGNPGMRAEVAEMFAGKTYVLFQYTFIRDVRLVFAPPSSVGNFGGDIDNWEWPRHTGDFTFMRAYVAPDGSSADFSPENVPYQPAHHIPVAAEGVNAGDFVFLLGYPGRTARHKTSAFLEFEEQVRLPWVVDTYQWQIGLMEDAGREDRDVAIRLSSRIKSLANVEKRSRGQLKGLERAGIVRSRAAGERALQSFIEADPRRRAKYGAVIGEIDQVYQEMRDSARLEMNLANLIRASTALATAFAIVDSAHERQKDDLERESRWTDRNRDRSRQRVLQAVQDWHGETDRQLLAGLRDRLAASPGAGDLEALQPLLEGTAFSPDSWEATGMRDRQQVANWLSYATPDQLQTSNDPFLQFMLQLYPEYLRLRELDKQRQGRLDQLYGLLIEIKQEFMKTAFVPDANGTLRMTWGRIEGYSPEDAIFKTPITTLRGVMEKTTGVPPFVTPERIQQLYAAGDWGRFSDPQLDQVPVNILYSTDTTGGNSGSPVLNARGELVGVNFDRAFEATINDFAWNHNYSRSLGVDIRYALWITDRVYDASQLLEEMGIDGGKANPQAAGKPTGNDP